MIRALIFDLGGVVIPFDFRRGYAAIEPHCAYPPEEIPKRIRASGLVPRYERGEIATETFVGELCAALDVRVGFAEFCGLWSAIFLPGTLIPENVLESLGQRYRMVALSNTNELHFREVQTKYPVIRHFDELVLSCRMGCAKPDRRIYEEAVRRAGCGAEECLFIDDVEAYVEGARSAGLEAVRFETFSQLEKEFLRQHIL